MNDLLCAQIYVFASGTGIRYLLINCNGNPDNN